MKNYFVKTENLKGEIKYAYFESKEEALRYIDKNLQDDNWLTLEKL